MADAGDARAAVNAACDGWIQRVRGIPREDWPPFFREVEGARSLLLEFIRRAEQGQIGPG